MKPWEATARRGLTQKELLRLDVISDLHRSLRDSLILVSKERQTLLKRGYDRVAYSEGKRPSGT